MRTQRRFHLQYREGVRLTDGTWAELRLVRPEDAALLKQGFARLSPRSRFQRFLSVKSRLSEEEVLYLTCVDGERHLALGAVQRDGRGREVGLGVARFIRLPDDPETAEVAITVVDDAQGKGLGRILLDRLLDAARERGVERFEFRVQAGNVPMCRLLRALAPCEPVLDDDDALCFSLPVGGMARPGAHEVLCSLLSLAAQGALTLMGPTCRWRGLPRLPWPVPLSRVTQGPVAGASSGW